MWYGTRIGRLVLGFILVTSLPTVATAEEAPAFRDLTLSVHCRQALATEPRLADLNLAVQVRKGIAEVRGRVPTDELERRAVQLIGEVQGILAVRNYLEVRAVFREPGRLVLEVEEPSSTRAALPIREDFPEVPLSIQPPVREPEPEVVPVPVLTPAPVRERTPPLVVLLPPVFTEEPPPRPVVPVPPRDVLVANPRTAPVRPANTSGLQALLADPTFRGIKVEERAGVVYVHNNSSQAAAVMALARQLSKLPEVAEIVLVPEGR